jgi:hypothetical protein
LELLTPQKPRPALPTLREAEAAGNISNVNLEQQLLVESAGGDSLPDLHLTVDSLQDVPVPDVPLPEVRPDGSAGEQ